MNALVIYKSTTGFTAKYAKWIAEALLCTAVAAEKAKNIDLSAYDAVVFGGWFFAGSIKGFKEYRQKFADFKGRKAVFAVGATPPSAPEAAATLNACFTDEERKTTGTFFMQGGLDYSHMGAIDKAMMRMMCAVMKKQKGADSEEYKTISQSFDATDKNAIAPLIEYIKGE